MNYHHLSLFVQVVLDGGFTAAAKSLHLPKSAVSAAVSKLEADLGVRLLNRTSRKVSLTDEGHALFIHASPAFDALKESEQVITEMHSALRGKIRITVSSGLGLHLLEPLISTFLARHPETSINVVSTMRKVDMVGEGFDLAVRGGDIEDDDLIARRIGSAEAGLYASPSFFEKHPAMLTLSDLKEIDFVILSSDQAVGTSVTLSGPQGIELLLVRPRLVCDHYQMAMSAVANGVGVGILPDMLCENEVASGRLVRVAPSYKALGKPIYLTYPRNRYVPRRVLALKDLILESYCS
ncbi:LysR family transcriptional regulator [Klebsiella aerogenes]|uniref:LysR family transcriptional regulator n=1 Tax=Klebsiella aerogenes TaxID=548 RepID=UPI0005754DAF|nr:LysR family transcriptional regulator [Klebsiella aerogenes]KHM32865.1 hypothetical protein KV34_12565 [Klebsiella aerogenes]